MPTWQRRARFLIAVVAIAFAIVVAVAFRPRVPAQPAVAPVPQTDPAAVVESASGTTIRVNREQEEVRVEYETLLTYPDGVTRMVGMKVTTVRAAGRTFVLTGNEGTVAQNPSAFEVSGDVVLTSDDGLMVRGREARYSDKDGVVRVPGPVTFREGRMTGTSVGMTYHKTSDTLTLLERAVVKVAPDEETDSLAIQADRAEINRTGRTMRFEGGMKAVGDTRVVEAHTATAFLGGDGGQLERLELRGDARISASRPSPGKLRTLTGTDMDLEYQEDGRSLRTAAIRDNAVIVLMGERGAQDRRIAAGRIDIDLDADGETPTALRADTDVRLALPGPKGAVTRTVAAETLDASGPRGAGLTAARFSGGVVFREQGAADRSVRSRTLETTMAPGLGEMQSARFAGDVRFVDGTLTAFGDRAAYGVADGTLALRASGDSAAPPRLVNERVAVEARELDVTLAGPKIRARAAVKSELLPAPANQAARAGNAGSERRVPSMLQADQPVIIVAEALDYDGGAARAVYNGTVRLSQGDTSIKSDALTLDERTGDLQAAGSVVTTTVLNHRAGDGPVERVASIARAGEFVYEEAVRRATYTGQAQVGGPHGEMRAARIELYLRPSGQELDRVEAYEDVTLLEQRRQTTGSRLTYFSEDTRYVVVGSPVKIVDDCKRETTGRTLTFYQDTDRVTVDGNEQIRTRTTGASTCP